MLPHGIGKQQRVVVFAKGAKAEEAKEAGADVVGEEELAEKIKDGWTEFDACIAAPDMMKLVGPLGKVLGPRGLMPSPRAGTVTPDVGKTVREYKAGKVEFRNDKGGIVQAVVGKLSFDAPKLTENIQAFIGQRARPQAGVGEGHVHQERAPQRDDEPERAVGSVGEAVSCQLSQCQNDASTLATSMLTAMQSMSKYVKDLITDDLRKRLDGVERCAVGQRDRPEERQDTCSCGKQLRAEEHPACWWSRTAWPGGRPKARALAPAFEGSEGTTGRGVGRRGHHLAGQGSRRDLARRRNSSRSRPRAASMDGQPLIGRRRCKQSASGPAGRSS